MKIGPNAHGEADLQKILFRAAGEPRNWTWATISKRGLADLTQSETLRSRPRPAIHPLSVMLRCGPSDRPFAASAKSAMSEFTRCGTNRTHADAVRSVAPSKASSDPMRSAAVRRPESGRLCRLPWSCSLPVFGRVPVRCLSYGLSRLSPAYLQPSKRLRSDPRQLLLQRLSARLVSQPEIWFLKRVGASPVQRIMARVREDCRW